MNLSTEVTSQVSVYTQTNDKERRTNLGQRGRAITIHSDTFPLRLINSDRMIDWSKTQRSHSLCSESPEWFNSGDWKSDSHSRWGMATQKIKNLLVVNDVLSVNRRRNRERDRAMSVEQKSNFLERFTTRDTRRFSGLSCDTRKRGDTNSNQVNELLVSTTELKEIFVADQSSKTNLSNYGDYFQKKAGCHFLHMLFEPYSTFIYIWSWIVLIAIHYNTWVIILRIAFQDAQKDYQPLWFSLDYTSDFIYLVDIIVMSRMSFLEDGIYVENIRRVTYKYFKSNVFFLDLLSLIPLDLLYLVLRVEPTLRLPRLIKFHKILEEKKTIESMTNFPNLLRGVFWLHTMFLLIHWNSCFFFIISKYEGFGSNKWVYPTLEGTSAKLSHQYIKSMYWSTLVLTTIGESNAPVTSIE